MKDKFKQRIIIGSVLFFLSVVILASSTLAYKETITIDIAQKNIYPMDGMTKPMNVITTKSGETFIINKSDIKTFDKLAVGNKYQVTVRGLTLGFVKNYRTIVEIK